jgi:hypothetical protein
MNHVPHMIGAGTAPMRVWVYRGWGWLCRLPVCAAPSRESWGLPDQKVAFTYALLHLEAWHTAKELEEFDAARGKVRTEARPARAADPGGQARSGLDVPEHPAMPAPRAAA